MLISLKFTQAHIIYQPYARIHGPETTEAYLWAHRAVASTPSSNVSIRVIEDTTGEVLHQDSIKPDELSYWLRDRNLYIMPMSWIETIRAMQHIKHRSKI